MSMIMNGVQVHEIYKLISNVFFLVFFFRDCYDFFNFSSFILINKMRILSLRFLGIFLMSNSEVSKLSPLMKYSYPLQLVAYRKVISTPTIWELNAKSTDAKWTFQHALWTGPISILGMMNLI